MTASKPDGRAARWNRHKAERRALILDAAITAVARQGGSVSVRRIADQAGVPRSVVYRIFRDREDLDEQLRAEILARLIAVLEPTLEPSGTVQHAICGAITTYVDWVSDNPLLHQFLGTGSASRPTTGSRAVTGTRNAIARQVTTMITAAATDTGADPAIAEPVAFGLVGLVDGAVNRWFHSASERVPADQLATFLSDAVWAVLEKQTAAWGRAITPETRIADLG